MAKAASLKSLWNVASGTRDTLGARKIAVALVPRPVGQNFAADIGYATLIVAGQSVVLPTLASWAWAVDVVTMWATAVVIRNTPLRSLGVVLFLAVAVETRTSLPRGVMICAYLWIWLAVTYLRSSLSWHRRATWYSILGGAQIVATGFVVGAQVMVQGGITAPWWLLERVIVTALLTWALAWAMHRQTLHRVNVLSRSAADHHDQAAHLASGGGP